MSIRARGELSLTHLRGAESADDDHFTVIDLSNVWFLDPYGMVGMAVHALTAKLDGQKVIFYPPTQERTANYLSRHGVTEMVEGLDLVANERLPEVQFHDQSAGLIALHPFNDTTTAESLATLVWNRMEQHQADPPVVEAVFAAVSELASNALEHGLVRDAESGWGLAAAQVYKRDQPGEKVVLAVADTGVGVRRALSRYEPTDDHFALKLALQEHVSGTEDQARGIGLPYIREQVLSLKGRMHLRSGDAEVRMSGAPAKGATSRNVDVVPMIGTLIGLELPCRPGQLSEERHR